MAAYTTIDAPSAYFKIQTYTGTGSSNAQTFADTDTDMQPDAVWIKSRTDEFNNMLYDSVRGVHKHIKPDGNNAEATDTNALTAFGSDGFTVGSNTDINNDGDTYVAWCWKAGTTTGINTTGADITLAAYSFNQKSGFSIIKYVGNDTADTQVPHGLGAVPKFALFKKLESTGRYQTYHHVLDTDEKLYLDDTHATVTDADAWNETDPTSVLWTIDVEDDANESGEDLVAYSWAPVQGYSSFGTYLGNDNADGTFIYTGFKPAWVMTKKISASGASWQICDNKRPGYNPIDDSLSADSTAAEQTHVAMDFCSNGFKCRNSNRDSNHNATYVYAAFAEAPLVNSNGVPCTAR